MPRILFVKTSSLGDVVHNLPAVSDVARCVPGATIDWLIEEPFAEVATLHAAVRRVIPVALRRWRRALWNPAVWSEIGALRRSLATERYDTVIDTQGLVKSALLCALARGEKHGMDRASLREPLAALGYDVRHTIPRAQHAVERNRQLAAAALGYPLPQGCDYGLRAERIAPRAAPGDYVVLLTMSSRGDKLWPEAQWIELGRALAERGLKSLLPWGDASERARCERLALGIGGAELAQRLSLGELARALRGARGVAGLDTGLSHLAAAAGVPVVGIYCATDPALTGLHGSARLRNLGSTGAPPAAARVLAALEELM
ncbi:MAG: lipopolysaccharide heptosyltransferase I [Betaproteobacteria bacterium RIFCSPLOWO2_02_67_12]|nr:MAG: lipopolysaccharide heptosyltransferase I [Betaproteobacteria bacterium RIFCSPLOWO2_02_67_12]OGA27660.1 MAG: lipopolysaccharide heptosyltransferase I [Betaproteobacteria bacterium RIFCSPLOWO2_02_FULL_68_150]OGA68788.1 MAG: lipopolysaccharide heptosyltransferase I [Betaproteobacteria bacterium RIFCSPLOWO2_12_FULL_67_28]